MAVSGTTLEGATLAVDIGATSIKFCPVDGQGHLLEEVTRVDTPYPCLPEVLVGVIADAVNASGCVRAGVGFPGDMIDGTVLEPGNLSRAGGISTPVDPTINELWLGCDVEGMLQARCRVPVRVVNDATLAAHGYATGEGRELVITLGTAFGISLMVEGRWQKIRDVGAAMFHDLGTYDEVFGEPARARDMDEWRRRLVVALSEFVVEFDADCVHVGGGNARHLGEQDLVELGCPVAFNDNEGTLRGAVRLFLE